LEGVEFLKGVEGVEGEEQRFLTKLNEILKKIQNYTCEEGKKIANNAIFNKYFE
jgi:hypothetical protein